jgi:CheY-like chemotaxis protein
MPFMTGIDFLNSLEAMTSDPSIKGIAWRPNVIVITSASPEQVPPGDLEARFPTMVHAVLRKPLVPERLSELLGSLLAESER